MIMNATTIISHVCGVGDVDKTRFIQFMIKLSKQKKNHTHLK